MTNAQGEGVSAPSPADWGELLALFRLVNRARGLPYVVGVEPPNPERERKVELIWPLVKANGFGARERAGHVLDALRS